jgi:hypothetical protein
MNNKQAAGMATRQHDLVIANGRIIDPESKLDVGRLLAISDGRI